MIDRRYNHSMRVPQTCPLRGKHSLDHCTTADADTWQAIGGLAAELVRKAVSQ